MAQHYIGIDLGGTKTEIVVLGPSHSAARPSEEVLRFRRATPVDDYQAILVNIAAMIAEAENSLGLADLPVGVGIPGTVSKHSGRIKNSNSQCLNGQAFKTDLQKLLGRSVTVMNDANCLAVSEAVDGAAQGRELVFAAILGTGCGAGIAYQGKALGGLNGLGGEWGHVPMPGVSEQQRHDRPCYCGEVGCIETFLSGTGLQRSYRQLSGKALSVEAIQQLEQQGEPLASETMANYRRQLLSGLTLIINILDPDIIVLGGGVSNVDSLYPYLNQHLPDSVFGRECDTPVVRSAHGDSSGVRGAAWLNR